MTPSDFHLQIHPHQNTLLSMAHHLSNTAIDIPSTGKLHQGGPSQHLKYAPSLSMSFQLSNTRPNGNRLSTTLVHHLDDDSLLVVFSFCRPVILDESEADNWRILGGGEWIRERWWYALIRVCRRWRYLILESAYHLQASLVCVRGTLVADMLLHSPPIPLIIDHFDEYQDLSAEDQEGVILALQHRDRVRRIRLVNPVPILQKLIAALEGEFPVLEHMYVRDHRNEERTSTIEHITNLRLPESFRAPHLRRLVLTNFAFPIESPSLTTTVNLVTLSLNDIPPSTYFHPDALLEHLLLMPQLETLGIGFNRHNPSRDVEMELLRTPITTPITLPNLRWLGFGGTCAYSEALLSWVTAPLLERLQVCLSDGTIYSIPRLRQFMSTAHNLRFKTVTFTFFEEWLQVAAYPHEGAKLVTLHMELGGRHLDWQVISAAHVFQALKTVFSPVDHLGIEYSRHNISSEWNNEADNIHWREFIGSFGNVKTLFVDGELVRQLSRALHPGEEESPTELLPKLQRLSYSAIGTSPDAFTPFIDARQKAGRPVTVIHP